MAENEKYIEVSTISISGVELSDGESGYQS